MTATTAQIAAAAQLRAAIAAVFAANAAFYAVCSEAVLLTQTGMALDGLAEQYEAAVTEAVEAIGVVEAK